MTEHRKKELIARLNRIADSVVFVTNIGCVLIGGIMTAVVVAGVFARYVMQNPMIWTEEIARMAMIWCAYLAMSIAVRRRGHLGVTFFVQKLPLLLQRVVKLFTDSVIALFLVVLIVNGVKIVIAAKIQIEPATGISMSYPFIIVPLSGILMLIQHSIVMLGDLLRWRTEISPFKLSTPGT
jgi:TRAP-type C4-dicarboxylate transport system permease small subunit